MRPTRRSLFSLIGGAAALPVALVMPKEARAVDPVAIDRAFDCARAADIANLRQLATTEHIRRILADFRALNKAAEDLGLATTGISEAAGRAIQARLDLAASQ